MDCEVLESIFFLFLFSIYSLWPFSFQSRLQLLPFLIHTITSALASHKSFRKYGCIIKPISIHISQRSQKTSNIPQNSNYSSNITHQRSRSEPNLKQAINTCIQHTILAPALCKQLLHIINTNRYIYLTITPEPIFNRTINQHIKPPNIFIERHQLLSGWKHKNHQIFSCE